MDPQTRDLLLDAVAAAAVILSPVLLAIGLLVARYLAKAFNLKDAHMLEWAVRQGVLLIEDTAKKRTLSSDEKKLAAREKARSMAPDGLKKHSDTKVDDVIEAQLTLLKPSIRPTAFLHSLAPGVNISLNPPELSIPPAPRVPRTSLSDEER
jgi:hypothetical protein